MTTIRERDALAIHGDTMSAEEMQTITDRGDLLAALDRLVEAYLVTADWLDGIIAETDPKPSELMAMVIGLRAALEDWVMTDSNERAYEADGALVVPWRVSYVIELQTPEQIAALPDGTVLRSIGGEEVIKGRDYIDLDTRAGLTAYGLQDRRDIFKWRPLHAVLKAER